MELNPRNWKPINGQVVIKDDIKADKVGAIFLPDTSEPDRLVSGTILAVSPFLLESGYLKDPPIEVGDKVIYGQHTGAGNSVKIGNAIFRLARWNEVFAIVIEEK